MTTVMSEYEDYVRALAQEQGYRLEKVAGGYALVNRQFEDVIRRLDGDGLMLSEIEDWLGPMSR